MLNRIRPILAQIWRRVQYMEGLESLSAAAKDRLFDQGLGVILLYDPPEELVPGSFDTLYRYFGWPSCDSTLPSRVTAWVEDRRDHRISSDALDTKPSLMVTRGGWQTVVRYLPGGNVHPGAITALREHPNGKSR